MDLNQKRRSVSGRRRLGLAVAALTAAATLLVGCTGNAPAESGAPVDPNAKSVLTILTQSPAFGFLPLQAMLDDGFAEDENLEINYLYFGQGGGSLSGVFASGQGDALFGGAEAAVQLAASGVSDVRIVGSLYQKGVWVGVSKSDSGYDTLADLKGQVLGISGPGAFSDLALRAAIKEDGLKDSDFQIAALGRAPTQLAALENGSAQFVQLQSPVLEGPLNSGDVKIVHDFRTPQASLVFNVRKSSLDNNRVAWEKFMRAYKKAMDKIQNDPAYALDLATRVWGADNSEAELKQQLASYIDDPGIWSDSGVMAKDEYDATVQVLEDGGAGYDPKKVPTYEEITEGTDLLG
jgi:ABC-type nitrate/sulfonate/bicarbonate transport system substrate-binding protein